MSHQHQRTTAYGQGLVEYALIVALVALVVMVAAFLVGLAVQRIFGVTAGVLGAKHNTTGAHLIEITTAQCIADPRQGESGLTGLWVLGNTTEDVHQLTGSTEQAVGTGLGGIAASVDANGPHGFVFNPLLAYTADLSVCPKAVVIQSTSGAVAVSPVEAVTAP